MKIFGIAISLAFLGVSYSVSGGPLDPNQSGGALDGICSAVRGLKACPPNSLPCTYETITIKKHSYDVLVKRPCSAPLQPAKCKASKDNEMQCMNDGCTWTDWIPKYSGLPAATECLEQFRCLGIVTESVCNKYSNQCMWDKDKGTCDERYE